MAEYENNTILETSPTGPEDEPSRNWIRLALMVIAAVIVAALLIFLARWVYNAITDDNSQGVVTEQTTESPLPAGPETENTNPGITGTPGTSTPPSGTGSQPSTTAPQSGNKLPNSGPEHVAAVFAGSSLVGAGIHYIVNRRRTA